MSIGSAKFKGPLADAPARLEGCGQLVLLSGTEDKGGFDSEERYFKLLQEKGADVTSVVFDGGHQVLAEPLITVVRPLLKN